MTMLFGQETFTLTETEVNNLFEQLKTYEIKDSLSTIQILELNNNIALYKKLELENGLILQDKDSLIILLNLKSKILNSIMK